MTNSSTPPAIRLTLDWPPSVNHYWRHFGGRVLISRDGRAYRSAVALQCRQLGIQPLTGDVSVALVCHPPDRRRRDLDNLLKALLDSLQHGGLLEDDSQVARLTVERGEVIEDGRVVVAIVGLVEGTHAN